MGKMGMSPRSPSGKRFPYPPLRDAARVPSLRTSPAPCPPQGLHAPQMASLRLISTENPLRMRGISRVCGKNVVIKARFHWILSWPSGILPASPDWAPSKETRQEEHAIKTKSRARRRIGGVYRHGRVYWCQWMHHGKKYKVSTGQIDKTSALAFLDEVTEPFRLRREAEIARVLSERATEKETRIPCLRLDKLWPSVEKSVAFANWTPETRDRIKARVTAFISWMKENHPEVVEVRDVGLEHAEQFVRHVLNVVKGKTANEYRSARRQSFEIVKAETRATSNVWGDVPRSSSTSHRRRALSEEELRKIFAHVTGEMRTLFAVGLYLGLRLGDAVCLRWADIDMETGVVRLVPSKTMRHGTEVVVSIKGSPLQTILEAVPMDNRTGYVMPGLAELYQRENWRLGEMIAKVFADCGIQTTVSSDKGRKSTEVGFHSLRHSFVSMSANAGVPLAIVQAVVGHTSTAMTQHYYHVSRDALDKAAQALPDFVTVNEQDAGGNA